MNRSAVGWADTPYRFGRIFQARGFGAKRLAKKRLRLMQAADEQIQSMLSESETVEFVSWGVEYSFVEQYFMGLWAHFINRRALVFTNCRILMFQIDSRWKVSGLKSQVRYRAITKVARGGLGTIGLVLRDGSKLCATGLPRKDRKPVKALVSGELQAIRADASGLGREHLCPHCGYRVIGFPERCNRCAGPFKSGARAGWLSLAFPGLGDFYLGHRGLGVVEMLGAITAWAVVVAPAALSEPASYSEAVLLGCAVFAFGHGGDFWITRRVGYKGIYPAE